MFRVRVFSRPFQLVGAVAAVVALLGLSLVIPPSSSVPVARAADSGTAVTLKRTLTDGKGKPYPDASVTVSQTTNLQQRQVIRVSWEGFEPSRNYLGGEPYPDWTEFPVVLLECWGADTPDKPMDPTHCQNAGRSPQLAPNIRGANRAYAIANEPAYPNPGGTDVVLNRSTTTLNFNSVDGTHWDMSNNNNMPLNLNGNAVIPDNSVVTFSDAKGSRSNVEFEVRGGQDVPVLGCSNKQACTLEVVPILQPHCNPGTDAMSKYISTKICAVGSMLPPGPGPNNAPGTRPDPKNPNITPNGMLMGGMWWLGGEWKNRFAFELNMAPLPGECAVVDQRPTVSVEGSEAPAPVMALWEQRFCFDPNSPFKLTHSFGVTEETARGYLVTQGPAGYMSNGIFTSLPVTGSPRPVVHAPVAVTGWTIAYKIDNHDGRNTEYTNLTLSPLLLAKSITSSYPGGSFPKDAEPALAGNPSSMFKDPEFKAFNPTFIPGGGGNGGDVIWDQFSADAFAAMFAYIDADPEARAWLDGKPDAYSGMVVNPEFRGKLKPPQTTVQYLDGWVNYQPNPGQPMPCRHDDPRPYFGFEMAGYNQVSLDAAARAVLNRYTPGPRCRLDPNNVYRWLKNDIVQHVGERSMLAFTTVPLAERYGLSLAKLQSHVPNSKAVGPSGWENPTKDSNRYDTLGPSLGYMKQDKDTGVVSPDFGVFPYNNPYAYPGVLPVYAAIPTCGLDATLAGRYADFLNFAAGAGQTPGMGGGQLPWGYTPLPKAYADYTKTAAAAVRDQKCEVPAPPPDLSGQVRNEAGLPAPGADGSAAGAPGSTGGRGVPGAGNTNPAGAAPGAGKSAPSNVAGRPSPAAATSATDSWLDAWGLVILLLAGLVAGLVVPVVRIAGEPGHPVRQFFAGLGQRQPSMVGRKPDVTVDAPDTSTTMTVRRRRDNHRT